MTREVSDLLKKALELPPKARATLANSLLESLDETVDTSAEEEWNKEIANRIAQLDSGSEANSMGRSASSDHSDPSWALSDFDALLTLFPLPRLFQQAGSDAR